MKRMNILNKVIASFTIACMLSGLFFSCPPVAFASSASAASSGSSSEGATNETEAAAKILPTDSVSTEDFALYGASCCVMDMETGQVLYYKNPAKKHYPASITKILTSLILIENAELDEKITFTEDCWEGITRTTDMNVAMEDGEKLTVKQALYCMLLVSANEVCNQVGIHVAGSIEGFAEMMNEKAASLGCTGSHFVTTNGLHNKKHYTTAYDMALISRAAILNDTFREITGTTYFKVKTKKRKKGFELYHKHRMLSAYSYQDSRCIGGKTGYTTEAGNTLVTYMKEDDVTLICVIMDDNNGHIYPETKTVCDYCFDKYDRESIDALAASEEGRAINEACSKKSAKKTSASNESSNTSGTDGSDGSASSSGDGNSGSGLISEILNLKELATTDADILSSESGSVVDVLKNRLIKLFLDNMPYSIAAVIILFILFTFFIVWLKGAIHRSIHRRRYRKLRKKRK